MQESIEMVRIRKKYLFNCYLLQDEVLLLKKIWGKENPTDMLIKTVIINKLKLSITSIGLKALGFGVCLRCTRNLDEKKKHDDVDEFSL